MNRHQWGSPATRFWGCAVAAALAALVMGAPAGAAVLTDDFSSFFDYSGGAVGGIWTASYNMANLAGGNFNSNVTNSGTLTVDDNNTTNVGWEPARSNAPYLATTVPAGNDFTATVRVTAQTNGQWSAAGLIARGLSPTPPGAAGPNNDDENYVTNFSFRTDPAVANTATTDIKVVQNGSLGPGNQDNNIAVTSGTSTLPMPFVLKLERVAGSVYRAYVSLDNGATFQFQRRVNTLPVTSPLRDATKPMEVGLGYMNFGGTFGTAQFDDFALEYHPIDAVGPGAPTITAGAPITLTRGATGFIKLTSDQGPLVWARSGASLGGTNGPVPSTQGGAQTPPIPTGQPNESWFRWVVPNTTVNGTYTTQVTGTNDWGSVSQPVNVTFTVIPEPASLALAGLAIFGFAVARRRK